MKIWISASDEVAGSSPVARASFLTLIHKGVFSLTEWTQNYGIILICQKIVIVGCPSSGKTTIANKIGSLLNIPVYHLDKIFGFKKAA